MRERPILFSGPMVRAILAGTKTQTRRKVNVAKLEATRGVAGKDSWQAGNIEDADYRRMAELWSPYGIPADRLWVRETFAYTGQAINDQPGYVFRATDPDWSTMEGFKWKPSIYMPWWASRITLEIVSVRVERLQDISGDDCIAEGIDPSDVPGIGSDSSAIKAYAALWESINGAGSWAANPWVWVISFRRLENKSLTH